MAPATFQRLVDDAEYGRCIRLIRRSLREFNAGRGIPAAMVFAELRRRLDGRGQ